MVSVKVLKNSLFEREFLIRILFFSSISILCIDTVYKTWNGITPLKRQWCILYNILPQWAFLIYEYFIELFLLVAVGILVAALIEKHFLRMKKYMPRHSFTAFVYASILPLCSCSVLPLISALDKKIPFHSIVTFVVAAPLLNPYIIMLSMTVLGVQYTVVRILSSMILAMSVGYIAEYFRRPDDRVTGMLACTPHGGCFSMKGNIFDTAFHTLKKIFPALIIAGILGIGVEIFAPVKYLAHLNLNDNLVGTIIVILVGIPVYFCNGADILFLQPLIAYSGLPLGTAIAFSLTSTSVCATSIILLSKFIGKKMTTIIVVSIMVITFLLSYLIQFIPKIYF